MLGVLPCLPRMRIYIVIPHTLLESGLLCFDLNTFISIRLTRMLFLPVYNHYFHFDRGPTASSSSKQTPTLVRFTNG
jgi:hypothetical protein